MDLQLQGKRALVTGASRGIGLAIARQLAREGCRVALAARDPAALASAAQTIRAESGTDPVTAIVDTAFDDQVKAMVDKVAGALGGIDILVNAAAKPGGQGAPPKLAEITDDLFWSDVNVKVMGYLRCAREAAPLMKARGWGRIINVSGTGARQTGNLIGSIRNVSVAALTKNLADELGPHGINVTVVHPGLTRTEKTAGVVSARAQREGTSEIEVEKKMAENTVVGRLITAEEVADVVAFLASPRASAMSGTIVTVDAGFVSRGYPHAARRPREERLR